MRKFMTVGLLTGMMFLCPSAAQAAPAIPWGGVQIAGTTMGTNCHANRCWGYGDITQQIVFVEAANFWDIIKCGAGVGALVAGNYLLIAKAKKVGGIYKAAKRIWKAKSKRRKVTAVRDMFGYVLGTGAVVEACT